MRVFLVEDHELLAQSLAAALRAEGNEVRIVTNGTPSEISRGAGDFAPAVALLDLDLGEGIGSGLQLIEPISASGAVVVMLTASKDQFRLAECVEAGAVGVVNKSASLDQLMDAVREAAELGSLLTPNQRQNLLAELRRQRAERERVLAPFRRLTDREQQVLSALMDGKSADAIAKEFFVSLATVRSQIRSILQKLQVNSQLSAVALARNAQWSYSEAGPASRG